MIWLIVFVVLVVLIGAFFSSTKINFDKRGTRNPIKAKRVLTMNEQPTFLRLKEALPEHHVLAQVSFNAFMTAKGYATRNLFNRKVADFVVLDNKFNVVAIVELDDSSHKGKEGRDAERDALIAEAGYKVIHYKRTPEIEKIKLDFGIQRDEAVKENIAQQIQPKEEPKTKLVGDAIIIQTDKELPKPNENNSSASNAQ
ncbi:DUF2726 domain-containing protein [Acinetobacter sp.]|uniref:DUF2726 domain-containing protein n=1 Tax=Acinetobacter sp. TaxID=472 RepID=UPI0035AF803B